jgi:hypothetical protein
MDFIASLFQFEFTADAAGLMHLSVYTMLATGVIIFLALMIITVPYGKHIVKEGI